MADPEAPAEKRRKTGGGAGPDERFVQLKTAREALELMETDDEFLKLYPYDMHELFDYGSIIRVGGADEAADQSPAPEPAPAPAPEIPAGCCKKECGLNFNFGLI